MGTDALASGTTPVVIVGGGPAGLVTALLLARAGVLCTLVERRAEVSALPKARGMHARAMEIFRSLDPGLEREFQAHALPLEPVARVQATLAAPVAAAFPTGGPALAEVSPCEGASVAQDVVESVLRDRVDRQPSIRALWGARCTSIEADASGALVGLSVPGRPDRQVRATFVVAADGARSAVRQLLGIPMQGPPDFPEQRIISFRADLSEWVGPRPGAIYLLTGSRSVLFWTHPDDRWVLTRSASPTPAAEMLRSALGTPDLVPEILVDNTFSPGTTCAERLRHGPVFLVGDAAHRVTPAGGTGMNMAIQDAHNLAWKLAAVLGGRADPVLLDSYAAEREPIGRLNAADSRAAWLAFAQGGSPSPGRGMREIDMGHTYRSGAVFGDDGDMPSDTGDGRDGKGEEGRSHGSPAGAGGADYRPTAAPGRRAPHLWLAPGRSILDLFGDDFVLLTGPAGDCWCSIRPGPGLRVEVVGAAEFPDRYGVGPGGAVLVRPDGHVAARWPTTPTVGPGGPAALVEGALRTVLGGCVGELIRGADLPAAGGVSLQPDRGTTARSRPVEVPQPRNPGGAAAPQA